MAKDRTYISYLLRLWSAEEEGEVRWRASLQSPQDGARTGFRSLAQLFAFLEDQTGLLEDEGGPDADAERGSTSEGLRI